MTGPAKIAWIITPWMALMVLPLMAQAAAPRDAIRNMPTFTHTSTFDIISADEPDGHTYTDTYRDNWKINWKTPQLKLASGAWVRLGLYYETTLTDKLKRMNATSQDTRYDRFTGNLEFDTKKDFKASFKWDQQDTLNGSTPSSTDRTWGSVTSKSFNAAWTRNNYPRITLGHTTKMTSHYVGRLQDHGSESATTRFAAEYKWQMTNEWQKASLVREFVRSDNYGKPYDDVHTATSTVKSTYEAQRTLNFPHLGKFALNLRHDETSSAGLGSAASSTTYITQYSAGLDGNIRNYPLHYGYKYWTQQAGYSNSDGYQNVKRELTLTLNPPVPAGKSGGVTYYHGVSEGNFVNNRKTTEEQRLDWTLNTNPRTSAKFKYSLKQITDRISLSRTEDTENLGASLRYNIPGGRGSVLMGLSEQIRRQPHSDTRTVAENLNLGTNFKLGPGTSLNLYFNQRLNDTRSGLLGLPKGKDEFLSRVTYKTSGQGLQLEATYQQTHWKSLTTEKKTDLESLNLKLSYQTNARWKYTLQLTTNSATNDSLAGQGYDYKTDERILATVTYSF